MLVHVQNMFYYLIQPTLATTLSVRFNKLTNLKNHIHMYVLFYYNKIF